MNNQTLMAAEWELLRQRTLEAIRSIDERTTADPHGPPIEPGWWLHMMAAARALRNNGMTDAQHMQSLWEAA